MVSLGATDIYACSGEESDSDGSEVCDTRLLDHAVSRVDLIIASATDRLEDTPEPTLADAAAQGELPARGAAARRRRLQRARAIKASCPNPAREAEIARILAARHPSAMRAYVERDGYHRVPPCLRKVTAELDAEQRYIVSLQEPGEASQALVRLLKRGEKEELLLGLRKRFQQVSARVLNAGQRTKARAELDQELASIKLDIDRLNQPYIFVETAPP